MEPPMRNPASIALAAPRGPATGWTSSVIERLGRRPVLAASVAVLIFFTLLALAAPLVAGDPAILNPIQRLKPPSAANWLGNRSVGRSILARGSSGHAGLAACRGGGRHRHHGDRRRHRRGGRLFPCGGRRHHAGHGCAQAIPRSCWPSRWWP